MRSNFEKLRVYQLSEELADGIWQLTRSWEQFAMDTIGKQIVRAADSIAANIAEGVGRGSFQDNRRFVRNARGSLYETKHWLHRAYSRRLLTDSQVERIKPLIDELTPKLNAYLDSIGQMPVERVADDQQHTIHGDVEPERLTTDNRTLTTNN
jgi:four helix bundle protein